MKRSFLLISGLFLFTVLHVQAESAAARSFVAQGDALYAERSQINVNKQALGFYREAIASDPTSAEAYWKASRAAWWVGTYATERSERLQYFNIGIQQAQKAIGLSPHTAQPHFWLGGNYGSYGNAKGVISSLMYVKPIKAEMADVIKYDDHYMGAGGYRILGILDYKVPSVAGGNKKRAEEELQKALAIDTQNPVTLYYLAEFYYTTGDKNQARSYLDRFQHATPSSDFTVEYSLMQPQAAELSRKLQL